MSEIINIFFGWRQVYVQIAFNTMLKGRATCTILNVKFKKKKLKTYFEFLTQQLAQFQMKN